MSFLDKLKGLFGSSNKNATTQEMMEKVQSLAESNSQMVQEVGEQIKNAIPGEKDDQLIDNVTDKLTGK